MEYKRHNNCKQEYNRRFSERHFYQLKQYNLRSRSNELAEHYLLSVIFLMFSRLIATRSVNFTLSFVSLASIDDQQPSAVVVTFPSLDDFKHNRIFHLHRRWSAKFETKISFSLVSSHSIVCVCVAAKRNNCGSQTEICKLQKNFSLAFALLFCRRRFLRAKGSELRAICGRAKRGSEALRTYTYWIRESFLRVLVGCEISWCDWRLFQGFRRILNVFEGI